MLTKRSTDTSTASLSTLQHLLQKHGCMRSYASKLGLPSDYTADWETLIVCLSSIGDPHAHLCRYWEYTPTKRLVLSIRGFSATEQAKLAELERELSTARGRIDVLRDELQTAPATKPTALPLATAVVRKSPATPADKVKLFRSLFRGRTDVFPVRFVSKKAGNPGYAPACSNKWEPGLCHLEHAIL